MMRRGFLLLACMLFFFAAACQKPIEMTSDLDVGGYKIAYIDIQPADEKMADNPEYWEMKKLILPRLQQRLPYMGQPPQVGLKITITRVNTSINVARAMLIGDSYGLYAYIQLWDIQTKRQLGKTSVAALGPTAGGLGGLAGHGIATATMELEENLADNFVEQLLKKLYPETK